jgi:phosphomannomutase
MAFSPSIFKAYDIRGVYPAELNEEAALAVGLAVASLVGRGRAVVGRDMRLSSPQLHTELIMGLRQGGIEVDDIDMVTIDAMYFAVGHLGYDVGIMVTASHNPPEYNGFKIMRRNTQWVRGRDLAEFIGKEKGPAERTGTLSEVDIWPEYLRHVLSFVHTQALRPLKLVIDAGNGMAGKAIPLLFKRFAVRGASAVLRAGRVVP